MICLHLTRDNHYEGVYLQLPATPAEIGEAFAELDEISTHTASTRIVGAISPIMNIGQYIKSADVNESGVLEKLNTLAEQIQRMGKQEKAIFSGALDAESINGLDDVLDIAGRLDQYIFIHGVTNDKDLGGFLVKRGYKDFPERVRPYLDYASIGAEYYANHGGTYTADGYVLRKSVMEPLLEQNRAQVFRVSLQTGLGRRSGYEPHQLVLPASIERMEHAKTALSIEDLAEAAIVQTDCLIPHLCGLIPLNNAGVAQLDELAENIESIIREDNALITYCAALCAERPQTFEDALAISIDLDDYEMVTEDTDEYGKEVLRRIGADDEIIDAIDGYMDFAGLGEASMLEEGVRRTAYGLVRRLSSPFPEPTQGQQML